MKTNFNRKVISDLLLRAAIESFENKKDIKLGLLSLNDKNGTIPWEEYIKNRQKNREGIQ